SRGTRWRDVYRARTPSARARPSRVPRAERTAVTRSPAAATLLLLLTLALPAFLGDLGRPGLADDEAKHAEIPRAMIASGDWLTPQINGTRYFEKPPLVYWLTALSYDAFG